VKGQKRVLHVDNVSACFLNKWIIRNAKLTPFISMCKPIECLSVCCLFSIRIMSKSQITLNSQTSLTAPQNKDGSEMLDTATLVLIGTGSLSLFVAFIEYAYSHRKQAHAEIA
jgi:hypothetical protein